jgi:hypothetical protein
MSVEQPKPAAGDRVVAKLFGVLLMVVGGLIVVLSGLCSLGVLVMMGTSPGSNGGALISGIAMVAVFGVVPLAVGAGVFLVGLFLWRGPRQADPKTFE